MYKIFRYLFSDQVDAEIDAVRTDVVLTAQVLGTVSYEDPIDVLESKFQNDKTFWDGADYINEHKVFHNIIDVAILTFNDKLSKESAGRDGDMWNRGAMYGAEMVRNITKRTAVLGKGQVAKPLTKEESLRIV